MHDHLLRATGEIASEDPEAGKVSGRDAAGPSPGGCRCQHLGRPVRLSAQGSAIGTLFASRGLISWQATAGEAAASIDEVRATPPNGSLIS